MASSAHARLDNLLVSLTLNLAEEVAAAFSRASGLAVGATTALLALDEFLDDAHVGRLAEVLGLTHSGAVRLVTVLEAEELAERRTGADRRRVEVHLTERGRRRAKAARAARDAVVRDTTSRLNTDEATTLEDLLARLVQARVSARVKHRRAGRAADKPGAWWCRTCDFAACGRPEGRCPALATAATLLAP